MKPEITVLTCCHAKHYHWIDAWLKQVNAQEDLHFHVQLVLHNWDSDEAVRITKDKVYAALANKGVSSVLSHNGPPVFGDAVNAGIDNIFSPYVAMWDIDDIIMPERIRLQRAFLVEYPEIEFLSGRMHQFFGDEPPSEMWDLYYRPEGEHDANIKSHFAIYDCLINKGRNCLGTSTMVFRTETMCRLGGFCMHDPGRSGLWPDYETWKKALRARCQFYRMEEMLAMWRRDSSSSRL